MKVSGDRVTNWEFFRQQWEDYELGTGIEHRPEPVRLATFRSVMGKGCIEIFLNLELTPDVRASVTSSLKALEAYFKPKTVVVYERFLFNSATQSSEEGIDEFVNRLRKMASSSVPLTRERILADYKDVFEGLGHIGESSTFVINPDHSPVQHAPTGIPVTLQKEVKEKIAELEKEGIIQKVTDPTDWISSMVIVSKPGKLRICLDPRDLNRAIQRPKYQMPTVEEILPKLSKAKVFTTLDAKDGFYQIGLDEESSKKTTF